MNERGFLDNLTFLVDTREQAPFEFPGCQTVRAALLVGDYSVAGLEGVVAVERKSLDDLLGCLTTGRERFEKELVRGRGLRYFAVVVERPLGDILDGRFRNGITPEAAFQSLIAFSVRYRLPFFFCQSRAEAERVTGSLLRKAARETFKEFTGIMAGAEPEGGGQK
jgi:DNA excision repair protein ERCC-4